MPPTHPATKPNHFPLLFFLVLSSCNESLITRSLTSIPSLLSLNYPIEGGISAGQQGACCETNITNMMPLSQINLLSVMCNKFQMPELCCVRTRPPGDELCTYVSVFLFVPERAKQDTESPPAVVVYVHRARTNWLVLNLCSAL